MRSENDLMSKLVMSKKIMDRASQIPNKGQDVQVANQTINVQEFSQPQSSYNIPQEFLQEGMGSPQPKQPQLPAKDRILNSKLPDEIKRLMIEHPISQPASQVNRSVLSDELVEKASRLMNVDAAGQIKNENYQAPKNRQLSDNNELKQLIRETMKEILAENGLLVESVNKNNEVFSFRVGKHIFEGKVTKIKKVA